MDIALCREWHNSAALLCGVAVTTLRFAVLCKLANGIASYS